MREIEETGWSGGGQNPADLSRREVQVFPNLLMSLLDCFYFLSDYSLYNVYSLTVSDDARHEGQGTRRD